MVILRSRIAHDELGRAARLKLSQPDIVHRIGQALYGLAHRQAPPLFLRKKATHTLEVRAVV